LSVAIHAVEPWPLKFIFDHLLRVKRTSRLPSIPALEALSPGLMLAVAALAIIVISGTRAITEYLSTYGFALVANRVLTEVRARVYRHLQSLSLSFHTKARSGDMIVRVIHDINMLKMVTINGVLPLLANMLVILTMVGLMFWMHWKLALLALATLPPLLFWTAKFARKVQHASRKVRQREAAMAATAAETVGAIQLIQPPFLEGLFNRLFWQQNIECQKEDVKTSRLTAALGRTVGVLLATSTALVLGYGGWLVLDGELTPGELLVFLAYLRAAA